MEEINQQWYFIKSRKEKLLLSRKSEYFSLPIKKGGFNKHEGYGSEQLSLLLSLSLFKATLKQQQIVIEVKKKRKIFHIG